MLTILYDNNYSSLLGALPPNICQLLDDKLSYEIPNAQRTNKFIDGIWDGRKRLFSKNTRIFPTGLLYLVESILQENKIDYRVIGRDFPDIQGDIDLDTTILRDYQLEAVVDAVDSMRGIIHFPTASGKSLILAGILSLIKRKSIVIVHRKELVQQMKEHCENFGLKVAVLQGSESVIGYYNNNWGDIDVFCAMVQTLHSIKKRDRKIFKSLTNIIEVLIIDEVK